MDMLIFAVTILLLVIFCYPILRYLARHLGVPVDAPAQTSVAPDSPPAVEAPLPSESSPSTTDTPRSNKAGGFLSVCFILVGGSLLYGLSSGKLSLDGLYAKWKPPQKSSSPVASEPMGLDWRIVDGIRWFHVTGTDTAGIGYSGWVSELFFRDSPPESSPEGKD
ncbi:MAG TPA: hypothetical protein PLP29_01300, partial [Candidatus Ozemobacteraceae bacterium]|nr:hypothetical protein [Candidatus Ozemobacteraceae bacterium]